MLQKFELQGVHYTISDKLKAYITRKIGGLDRYISRHSRESAHAEVFLKESKRKDNNHCTCEVKLHLPHETIIISENALNMFAAVDIVEVKLKQRLQKYKDLHSNGKLHRRLVARLRRREA